MDKEISKKIFIKNKILTPKYINYSYDKNEKALTTKVKKYLKFPVVVKPINEGLVLMFSFATKKIFLKKLNYLEVIKKL